MQIKSSTDCAQCSEIVVIEAYGGKENPGLYNQGDEHSGQRNSRCKGPEAEQPEDFYMRMV